MIRVEKRVSRIIDVDCDERLLFDVADDVCMSFFEKVKENAEHPL